VWKSKEEKRAMSVRFDLEKWRYPFDLLNEVLEGCLSRSRLNWKSEG
jgi:hypothetical protein